MFFIPRIATLLKRLTAVVLSIALISTSVPPASAARICVVSPSFGTELGSQALAVLFNSSRKMNPHAWRLPASLAYWKALARNGNQSLAIIKGRHYLPRGAIAQEPAERFDGAKSMLRALPVPPQMIAQTMRAFLPVLLIVLGTVFITSVAPDLLAHLNLGGSEMASAELIPIGFGLGARRALDAKALGETFRSKAERRLGVEIRTSPTHWQAHELGFRRLHHLPDVNEKPYLEVPATLGNLPEHGNAIFTLMESFLDHPDPVAAKPAVLELLKEMNREWLPAMQRAGDGMALSLESMEDALVLPVMSYLPDETVVERVKALTIYSPRAAALYLGYAGPHDMQTSSTHPPDQQMLSLLIASVLWGAESLRKEVGHKLATPEERKLFKRYKTALIRGLVVSHEKPAIYREKIYPGVLWHLHDLQSIGKSSVSKEDQSGDIESLIAKTLTDSRGGSLPSHVPDTVLHTYYLMGNRTVEAISKDNAQRPFYPTTLWDVADGTVREEVEKRLFASDDAHYNFSPDELEPSYQLVMKHAQNSLQPRGESAAPVGDQGRFAPHRGRPLMTPGDDPEGLHPRSHWAANTFANRDDWMEARRFLNDSVILAEDVLDKRAIRIQGIDFYFFKDDANNWYFTTPLDMGERFHIKRDHLYQLGGTGQGLKYLQIMQFGDEYTRWTLPHLMLMPLAPSHTDIQWVKEGLRITNKKGPSTILLVSKMLPPWDLKKALSYVYAGKDESGTMDQRFLEVLAGRSLEQKREFLRALVWIADWEGVAELIANALSQETEENRYSSSHADLLSVVSDDSGESFEVLVRILSWADDALLKEIENRIGHVVTPTEMLLLNLLDDALLRREIRLFHEERPYRKGAYFQRKATRLFQHAVDFYAELKNNLIAQKHAEKYQELVSFEEGKAGSKKSIVSLLQTLRNFFFRETDAFARLVVIDQIIEVEAVFAEFLKRTENSTASSFQRFSDGSIEHKNTLIVQQQTELGLLPGPKPYDPPSTAGAPLMHHDTYREAMLKPFRPFVDKADEDDMLRRLGFDPQLDLRVQMLLEKREGLQTHFAPREEQPHFRTRHEAVAFALSHGNDKHTETRIRQAIWIFRLTAISSLLSGLFSALSFLVVARYAYGGWVGHAVKVEDWVDAPALVFLLVVLSFVLARYTGRWFGDEAGIEAHKRWNQKQALMNHERYDQFNELEIDVWNEKTKMSISLGLIALFEDLYTGQIFDRASAEMAYLRLWHSSNEVALKQEYERLFSHPSFEELLERWKESDEAIRRDLQAVFAVKPNEKSPEVYQKQLLLSEMAYRLVMPGAELTSGAEDPLKNESSRQADSALPHLSWQELGDRLRLFTRKPAVDAVRMTYSLGHEVSKSQINDQSPEVSLTYNAKTPIQSMDQWLDSVAHRFEDLYGKQVFEGRHFRLSFMQEGIGRQYTARVSLEPFTPSHHYDAEIDVIQLSRWADFLLRSQHPMVDRIVFEGSNSKSDLMPGFTATQYAAWSQPLRFQMSAAVEFNHSYGLQVPSLVLSYRMDKEGRFIASVRIEAGQALMNYPQFFDWFKRWENLPPLKGFEPPEPYTLSYHFIDYSQEGQGGNVQSLLRFGATQAQYESWFHALTQNVNDYVYLDPDLVRFKIQIRKEGDSHRRGVSTVIHILPVKHESKLTPITRRFFPKHLGLLFAGLLTSLLQSLSAWSGHPPRPSSPPSVLAVQA